MNDLWREAWWVMAWALFGPNLSTVWIGVAVVVAVWYGVKEIRE